MDGGPDSEGVGGHLGQIEDSDGHKIDRRAIGGGASGNTEDQAGFHPAAAGDGIGCGKGQVLALLEIVCRRSRTVSPGATMNTARLKSLFRLG